MIYYLFYSDVQWNDMIYNDITWYNMWRIYFEMRWYDRRWDTMHHIIWYVLWHTMTWSTLVSNMKHDDLISYDMIRNEDYILLEPLLGYHMLYLDTLLYAIVNYNCPNMNSYGASFYMIC